MYIKGNVTAVLLWSSNLKCHRPPWSARPFMVTEKAPQTGSPLPHFLIRTVLSAAYLWKSPEAAMQSCSSCTAERKHGYEQTGGAVDVNSLYCWGGFECWTLPLHWAHRMENRKTAGRDEIPEQERHGGGHVCRRRISCFTKTHLHLKNMRRTSSADEFGLKQLIKDNILGFLRNKNIFLWDPWIKASHWPDKGSLASIRPSGFTEYLFNLSKDYRAPSYVILERLWISFCSDWIHWSSPGGSWASLASLAF